MSAYSASRRHRQEHTAEDPTPAQGGSQQQQATTGSRTAPIFFISAASPDTASTRNHQHDRPNRRPTRPCRDFVSQTARFMMISVTVPRHARCRDSDSQPFHRAQHRDRRRNQRIAVKQRRGRAPPASRLPACSIARSQRSLHPAQIATGCRLPLVVGAHDHTTYLSVTTPAGPEDSTAPPSTARRSVGPPAPERGLEPIQRTGADVAPYTHAHRADHGVDDRRGVSRVLSGAAWRAPGRGPLRLGGHSIEPRQRCAPQRQAKISSTRRRIGAIASDLVVVGYLLARPNGADGFDGKPAIIDQRLAVRIAGVVDEARLVAIGAAIDHHAAVDDEQEGVIVADGLCS